MATQANISDYYDALRAGEDPDTYADILSNIMYDQGFLSTGADFAEAGAYGSYSPDVFTTTVDTSNVGDFTFNKSLSDFDGYDFEFGNISNDDLKKFQEELMPALAPLVAEAQLRGQSYENALMEAYEISPKVQGIYSKYGVSPKRISTNNQSEYVYDPFTFGEIQTVDRSMGFNDYLGAAVKAGLTTVAGAGLGSALAGTSLFGGAQSALGTAVSRSLSSAAIAGATGGDPAKAALTSGINSGLGILEAQAPALYNDIEFAYNVARGEPGLALLNRGLNVIEDGKITGTTTVGEKFTTDALNNVGLTSDSLVNYNINQNDLVSGLVKVEEELIQGEDLEDSLQSGLIEYAREGGGVPDFGINLGIALETPEFLSGIASAIRDVGSAFDDAILQPPKEAIEEFGSAFDDAILQPSKEAIEELYEAIPKPDVSLRGPDIDIKGPDINLEGPDVDIKAPDIEAPDLGLDPSLSLQIATGGKPTKSITESLFEDFLFEKKYQSPELLERRIPLQDYQAPLDIFRRTI